MNEQLSMSINGFKTDVTAEAVKSLVAKLPQIKHHCDEFGDKKTFDDCNLVDTCKVYLLECPVLQDDIDNVELISNEQDDINTRVWNDQYSLQVVIAALLRYAIHEMEGIDVTVSAATDNYNITINPACKAAYEMTTAERELTRESFVSIILKYANALHSGDLGAYTAGKNIKTVGDLITALSDIPRDAKIVYDADTIVYDTTERTVHITTEDGAKSIIRSANAGSFNIYAPDDKTVFGVYIANGCVHKSAYHGYSTLEEAVENAALVMRMSECRIEYDENKDIWYVLDKNNNRKTNLDDEPIVAFYGENYENGIDYKLIKKWSNVINEDMPWYVFDKKQ
jgi:hypothetical protein